MTTIIEHIGITPGLSPWAVQIAMLPVRRTYSDDFRNEAAKARSAAGRAVRLGDMKQLAARNRAKIMRHFKGRLEFKASQIAIKTGLNTETVRNVLNYMADLGLLNRRRENRTDWFTLTHPNA